MDNGWPVCVVCTCTNVSHGSGTTCVTVQQVLTERKLAFNRQSLSVTVCGGVREWLLNELDAWGIRPG
jgi:hypothetical protein